MDSIFKALADPARRKLLDALRIQDGQTLSDLETHLDLSRFGVMKHLGVLEDAGLITTRKRGRFKDHYLNAVPLQQALDRWIEPYRVAPTTRAILDLKTQLERDFAMDETPDFIHETFIRCTQDKLWDALTDTDQHAAYHFACNAAKGDVTGDGINYLRADGSTMLTQRTVEITPKTRIDMTFEPNFGGTNVPTSKCVYLVEAQGDMCKLTIEHYGIPDGQDMVRQGWALWASSLKSYMETGTPIKVDMAAPT
ncbi:MAG: metalloregulator ArsR/SmtB family transcription factor [Pseudomonadota bacterium]